MQMNGPVHQGRENWVETKKREGRKAKEEMDRKEEPGVKALRSQGRIIMIIMIVFLERLFM